MRKKWKGLLGFLLAAAMSLTACGSGFTDEVALKIDDREIMKSAYMVYLYTTTQSFVAMAGEDVWSMDFDGQTADELVEERTISTLQSVIAAEDYAKANGIALTEEQKAEAKLAAEQFISSVTAEDLEKMGMDAKKLIPLMESSYLYSLVYGEIAAECDVDAEDMAAYYQENKEKIKSDYTTLRLSTILLDDAEKAEEAMERAKNGEDFAKLFAEYDKTPEAENGGEMMLTQSQLQAGFGLTESLEVDDLTGPIKMGEHYFILKTLEKEVPTEAEVKEMAEGTYRTNIQAEYTEARFAEMTKAQKVEKMETVLETVEKFH